MTAYGSGSVTVGVRYGDGVGGGVDESGMESVTVLGMESVMVLGMESVRMSGVVNASWMESVRVLLDAVNPSRSKQNKRLNQKSMYRLLPSLYVMSEPKGG